MFAGLVNKEFLIIGPAVIVGILLMTHDHVLGNNGNNGNDLKMMVELSHSECLHYMMHICFF